MAPRFFFLAAILVLVAACGGRSDDPLIQKLTTIIPPLDDVRGEFPDRPFELEVALEGTGNFDNDDFSEFSSVSLQEVQDSGRLTGYRATYEGGGNLRYGYLLSAGVILSLYDDSSSAQQALERGPRWASGAALETYGPGDSSLAWPMRSVSYNSSTQVPSCPCEVWVRVGRLLAAVDVSHGGPPEVGELPLEDTVALAELMAERMRAIDQS